MATMIEPFTLSVPEAELEDLRARLRATRWPEPATDPRQGVALERLQERGARWAQDYDWRATERCLNAVPQFTTMIDGLRIHFLHARSPRPDAFPLVLTHAWAALMARLGNTRYGAQGTDWATSISASLGQQDPAHTASIHLMPPLAPTAAAGRQPDEDAGYSPPQRTRPQT